MVAPKNSLKDKPALEKDRLQSADETQKQVDGFDSELAELKARYDQYFLGLERTEPLKDRESFKKRLNALRTSHIRNTGLKFRVQALWQKYMSYERMWQRIAREIEEGTYSRDLFKARMRNRKREKRADGKPNEAGEADEADDSLRIDEAEMAELGSGDLQAALAAATQAVEARKAPPPPPKSEPKAPPPEPVLVRPASAPAVPKPPPPPPGAAAANRPVSNPAAARPPPPPPGAAAANRPVSTPGAVRPPPPPPPGAAAGNRPVSAPGAVRPPPPPGAPRAPAPAAGGRGGVPDEKMRAIYNAYVAAKRQCRESTDGLTYESVSKTINQQMPELMKQHQAKAVDFKVVIKNGKATLKAVPRT